MLCNCSLPPNDEFDYLCELCRPKTDGNPVLTQFFGTSGVFYQCKQCYLEYDKMVDLELHQRTCGKVLSEDSSEVDWKHINKPKYLKKRKKIIKKSFKCVYCLKEFSRKNTLTTHTKKRHNYLCNFCGQTFVQKTSLNAHVKKHRKLSKCGKNHVKSHNKELPYKCKECGKSFRQKGYLNGHLRNIHNIEGQLESYGCDYCLEHFDRRALLIAHLKQCSVYQCWMCKATFTTRRGRDSHQCVYTLSQSVQ